jgi:hypothetical protein
MFSEEPAYESDSAESRTELFYTGKYLPDAKETGQVILLDVDAATAS